MFIDINEFVLLFLTGNDLQNVICHMCNQRTGLVSDPITETLSVISTTPLSIVITEAGVAMFKNQPTMVWPYSSMHSKQLLYIKRVIDTLVTNSSDDNLKLNGHVQMGGGCIVMVPSSRQQKEFIINSKDILLAFVDSVNDSLRYDGWTKKALSSIIIQRLTCVVNIPKEVIVAATTYAETRNQ
jgi:hypothetical protein